MKAPVYPASAASKPSQTAVCFGGSIVAVPDSDGLRGTRAPTTLDAADFAR